MAKKVNLPDLLLGITFQRLKFFWHIHLKMVNIETKCDTTSWRQSQLSWKALTCAVGTLHCLEIFLTTISGEYNYVIHFLIPSNMWPEMVRAIPHTIMVIPTTTQLWYLSGEMNVIQFCISAGWTMRITWRFSIMGVLSITFLRLPVTKSPEILEITQIKEYEKL